MKKERKELNIWIDYSDREEMEEAIFKIIREIRSGIRYNREMTGNSMSEWSVKLENPIDYREEIINGKFCLVFQSKLNQK